MKNSPTPHRNPDWKERFLDTFFDLTRDEDAGATGLLAVSGGADSIAMLYLFWKTVSSACEFIVGHVHHGTGAFADRARDHVRQTCEHLGVPCMERYVDVPGTVKKRQSFEAVARELRYHALGDIAKEHQCDWIATAHTADDVTETTLLYLLRGSGLAGVAGLRPKSGNTIRPMLSFRRKELTGFLEEIGASWVEDPMNEDERFTRVKIRKRLRPFMEEEFGLGTWKAVSRAAAFLAGAEDALETEAWCKFDECTIRRFPHWVSLDGSVLQGYLEEWRYRVIRYAFAHADGVPASDLHLKLHEVQRIEQFIMRRAKGARLALRNRIELRWRADCIIFNGLFRVEPLTWQIPDILELPDGAFLLAEERPVSEFRGKSHRPGRVEWVDADKFGATLEVRPLRVGDRLAAIGDTEPRKIPKLLQGNQCHHGQTWIVRDPHEIKFIAGHRIAKSVAVTSATKRVLRLTWVPPEPIVP